MSGHEFARVGECGHKGKLAAEDGGGADEREATGVGSRFALFATAEFLHHFFNKR
jgi:hypothetical protein